MRFAIGAGTAQLRDHAKRLTRCGLAGAARLMFTTTSQEPKWVLLPVSVARTDNALTKRVMYFLQRPSVLQAQSLSTRTAETARISHPSVSRRVKRYAYENLSNRHLPTLPNVSIGLPRVGHQTVQHDRPRGPYNGVRLHASVTKTRALPPQHDEPVAVRARPIAPHVHVRRGRLDIARAAAAGTAASQRG